MMASTHAAIGVVVYAGLCAVMGADVTPAALGASAIGAWLPDADTTSSKAGFCLYPLAAWVERRFGHRTITHSFLGTLLFATICAPLVWWPAWEPVYLALVCGYASHLLADAATKSGVPLAWPNRRAWVFPGDAQYRVRTGSRAELGVLAVFVLLGLLTIPIQQHGIRRLLHMATNSLGGAVRDAEDWSDQRQFARVEGYDVLNQKVVSGFWPVVGRRDDGALIVERDDGATGYWLLSEGGSELHRIAPRTVRIEKFGPSNSQTKSARVANISFAALSRALAEVQKTPSFERDELDTGPDSPGARAGLEGSVFLHPVLVSGEGQCWPLPKDPAFSPLDAPQFGLKAVAFSGQKVSFDFAQPHHISEAGTRVAIRSAVLSIKMPDGATLPNLERPLVRREIVARAMLRHADLLVREGDLAKGGSALCRTFGQSFKREPTPEEEDKRREANQARRQLETLEVEERALKTRAVSIWAQMAPSYSQRRAALEAQSRWTAPLPAKQKAPTPAVAPFDCVVENIEWELPTTPTHKGEHAEQSAKVTLVQILR